MDLDRAPVDEWLIALLDDETSAVWELGGASADADGPPCGALYTVPASGWRSSGCARVASLRFGWQASAIGVDRRAVQALADAVRAALRGVRWPVVLAGQSLTTWEPTQTVGVGRRKGDPRALWMASESFEIEVAERH